MQCNVWSIFRYWLDIHLYCSLASCASGCIKVTTAITSFTSLTISPCLKFPSSWRIGPALAPCPPQERTIASQSEAMSLRQYPCTAMVFSCRLPSAAAACSCFEPQPFNLGSRGRPPWELALAFALVLICPAAHLKRQEATTRTRRRVVLAYCLKYLEEGGYFLSTFFAHLDWTFLCYQMIKSAKEHSKQKANTRGAHQRTNARDTLADGSITDFVWIIPTFGKANTIYTSFFQHLSGSYWHPRQALSLSRVLNFFRWWLFYGLILSLDSTHGLGPSELNQAYQMKSTISNLPN